MSDAETDAVLKELGRKSVVSRRRARYVGAEGGQALVDMGDQRFPVPFASAGFVPQINEPVWVDGVDGSLFMTGPVAAKPGTGVVVTTGDPLVTVQTDFGDFAMPFAGDQPTSGDTVGISWSTEPWCVRLSTSVDPPPPPPAPVPPASGVKVAEFRAVDAGSVGKGSSHWWTPRPWSRIAAASPRWGTHNLLWKSGAPVVSGSAEFDTGDGWVSFPWAADWFHGLKAGGSAAGIALNAQGTGQEEARSLAEDGMSGALRIRWR